MVLFIEYLINYIKGEYVMDIKKRLKTPYSDEVDAVLLNDEGEEYPVFLESLHNTIIFPMLIESGYVLEELPYGFIRDGVSMKDLPVEKFKPAEDVEERMYNSIGAKVPMEEINKHVHATVSKFPIPRTNYTIFTREDFLSYLKATKVAQTEDDFMPLNYFVAPEARFTIQEWSDPVNLEYVHLIDERRKMSLSKFTNLIKALRQINLPATYTAMDVIDSYFSWGMDGLRFDILNRRRESRAFRLVPNRTVNAPMINKTFGFVDGSRNVFVPNHLRNIQWRLANKDPKFLDTITAGLRPNDVVLVGFTAGAKQDVTTLEGENFNIRYSCDTVIMQLQTYPTILVQSPVSTHEYLDLELALPNNKEALYEHCTMEALSRMVYDYRKPVVRVSSYDALTVAGCNPRTVLDYIITKYDMSKEIKAGTEDAAPQILDYDIDTYLKDAKDLQDDVRSFLDDVVDGVFNIDNIEKGKQVEASVNTSSVYQEIFALHYVLGISFQEMYDKFRSITPEIKEIVFDNGTHNYRMDVTPLNYSLNGYKRDLTSYDLQNSRDCTFFTFVTLIAREVGDERARRHVGIEFYLVNKKYAPVKAVLQDLENKYSNRVSTMIPDVTAQAKQMRLVHMFSLSRYFEIVFKGTVTWPKVIGGEVETIPAETVNTCRRYLERKIENITAYCAFTAQTATSRSLTFNAYCTNAYITPEYVIPRSEAPIREIPFFTAWFDWQTQQPGIWQALVQANVIKPDFVPWERRYISEQFVQREMLQLDAADSLIYYYNHANEELKSYPADKDFISVTHPVEYMFPGLQDELDRMNSMATLPVPRQGDPVIRLGVTHDIKKSDYSDKLLPSEPVVKADTYIRPFQGFDAMTVMTVDNVLDKMPTQVNDSLTVMELSDSVYVPDIGEVIHYTRITELDKEKYGIRHICDRNYLFRATDGKVWEVRV